MSEHPTNQLSSGGILELTEKNLASRLAAEGINKERWMLADLRNLCNTSCTRIISLFGLRRTGKSVMMWTMALELIQQGRRVEFWEVLINTSAHDVIEKLKTLSRDEYDFLFIDEATYAGGFPDWGLYLYNTHAVYGKHVILSGTHSYAIQVAAEDALYNRIIRLSTTYISYKEYNYLKGTSLDAFLTNGGILDPIQHDWREYLETAVVENLVSGFKRLTLSTYKPMANLPEPYIRTLLYYTLQDVYVNPILSVSSLKYEFEDLKDSLGNLLGRGKSFTPGEITNTERDITESLGLVALEGNEAKTQLLKFREVLQHIGLLDRIKVMSLLDDMPHSHYEYFITQAGLMYFLTLTSEESVFRNVREYAELYKNLETVVRGRILENTVAQYLMTRYPESSITKLSGLGLEVDIVVSHPSGELHLYEVKHSDKPRSGFARYLKDTRLPLLLKEIYGRNAADSKTVLYRGPNKQDPDVDFRNVEKFLVM